MKTSVVHNDKIKCDHKGSMVIWDSYENYATCKRCGYHDWSGLNDDFSIASYKEKYPNAEVVDIFDGMDAEITENEFKCDQCGEVFNKGWSDEEAWEEAEQFKDEIKTFGVATVCDDCYNKIMGRK